jgi:hypothetical protein
MMSPEHGKIREDFYEERTRILDALRRAGNDHILLRLIGALAFRTHCPQYGYIQDSLGRAFTDIDFVSYQRYFGDIVRLLTDLGYQEDKMVSRLFSEVRLLFHDRQFGRHIDIFFDRLDFSHAIPLKDRLEVDSPTLPLAELFLEKMQIAKINEKDLIDTIMLLREHPIGRSDDETINCEIVCGLTANDWGLWRTLTGNLEVVNEFLGAYQQLTSDDRLVVRGRMKELRERIDATPKSAKWKLRSRIGDRVKWYKDVEELAGR